MDGVTRWLRWDAGRGDGDGGWVIWRTCTGWCHVDRAETTVQGWDIGSSGRFVEVANFLQLLVDALIDVPVVGPVEEVGTRADVYGWGGGVSPV